MDLKNKLKGIYHESNEIYLTENGRVAQYIFLKSLNLKPGDKVAVQGFTCNASINPILWLGLKPNYIDINPQTLNIDFEDLKKKLDEKTKVVIIQHTFGKEAELEKLLNICKERSIYIFEDCAHCLGSKSTFSKDKRLGSFGDASLISFGLEKVLSTRVGGALVLNNPKLKENIDSEYSKLKEMSYFSTFIWILNPIIWRFLRKLGVFQNPLAKILNNLGLLNLGFYKGEMEGKMPLIYPRKLSNSLAGIALYELGNIDDNLNHRLFNSKQYYDLLRNNENVNLVEKFFDTPPFIRFPIIMKSKEIRDYVFNELVRNGVYAGKWYDPNIYPENTSMSGMKYTFGTCPVAENISKKIIHLPTGSNITQKKVTNIVNLFNKILNEYNER